LQNCTDVTHDHLSASSEYIISRVGSGDRIWAKGVPMGMISINSVTTEETATLSSYKTEIFP
jgi:hypothetical protein